MADEKTEIQIAASRKIVCTLPPPPPIPATLEHEILSQYELMMSSLEPQSSNGANNGGHLESRAMNRDCMNAYKLSNDENAKTLSSATLPSSAPTQSREERIAFSDKYKCLRRKVKIVPVRDPRLHANESFRMPSDQNSTHKYNGCVTASPHIIQPLKQHNLVSIPSSDTHVSQPQLQPQPRKETYGEYRIRKEWESKQEAERKRKMQEEEGAAADSLAVSIGDGQTDDESKLKQERDTNSNKNPFKTAKMMNSTSGNGTSTILPKQKETYADYRRRKEIEEAEKREEATTTSLAATGSEIDEDWE